MTRTDAVAKPSESVISNEVFLRNMAALWRTCPDLAQQLDDLPDSVLLPVVPSRAGPPTLAVQADGGRTVWLHSRYDPRKQAEQLAQAVDSQKPCLVLTGMGLGYPAEAIWRRTEGHCLVIVIEPDLSLLFTALHCVDLAEPIAADRLVFLTQEDAAHIHGRLEPHNLLLMAGTQIITFQPGMEMAGEFHNRMTRRIAEFAGFCRMSLVTIISNSQVTCRNIANNLPAYLATPSIDVLRGRFAGRPGIVVAAGPSLRKNLHLLAAAKGKAVICCVQTLFKTLLAAGIVPDFVTSLDYHELSRQFFEGLDDFHGVHLIAEPKVTPRVVDAYRGPISLLNNSFAHLCLGDDLAGKAGLKAGATVAHLAFYLLEYLGCDPIIFIGQDLAFSDGLYYAPGVAVHQTWQAELNRYNSLEMLEWLRIVRHRPILHPAQDVAGNPVFTDEQMLTYLRQFERDFARSSARIIDATEGGLAKRATERMAFAEALERFCREPIPAEAFAYRRELKWWDPARLEEGRRRILQRLDRLEHFIQLCEDTRGEVKALKGLVDSPKDFNRRLAGVDQSRVRVQADAVIFQMVSELAQHAEFRKLTADRLIESSRASPIDRARRQLQRDEEYLEALIEAAQALREILQETVERFDAAIRCPRELLPK